MYRDQSPNLPIVFSNTHEAPLQQDNLFAETSPNLPTVYYRHRHSHLCPYTPLTIHRMDPVGALLCSFPKRVFTVASPKSPILTNSSWRKMSVSRQGHANIPAQSQSSTIYAYVHTYVSTFHRQGNRCLRDRLLAASQLSHAVRTYVRRITPATVHTVTADCMVGHSGHMNTMYACMYVYEARLFEYHFSISTPQPVHTYIRTYSGPVPLMYCTPQHVLFTKGGCRATEISKILEQPVLTKLLPVAYTLHTSYKVATPAVYATPIHLGILYRGKYCLGYVRTYVCTYVRMYA